ncbi:LysR substrate-binding domain-containing protein [Vibrio mexicanus]|uniref:LysR substrate-binding domain-containing protein n=1 Tax=Vibrio mexicanus TaxID=1004326 RepID=UPI00063C898C|nr:LysR substrate-binding domain-containing protein [Vibrio mexicanus]
MDNRLRHLAALRYFEAAARHCNYSKAASELCISQAAVSQKIRQLEETLDCKLFMRQGREMILTDKGSTLFSEVKKGFEHIVAGLNQIQSEPIEGLLSVSCPPSFASRWLLPRLWKFSVLHPSIPIKVNSTCDSPDLRHGHVDLAIVQGETLEEDVELTRQTLIEEKIYAYCSPQLAKSMDLSDPEQLQRCWLVHYGVESISWQNWFKAANVEINTDQIQWMEVETFEMALSTVMAGHGVCLASESLASSLIEQGLLCRTFDIGMSPGIKFSMCSDPNSPRKVRCSLFSDWLVSEVAVDSQS